LFFIEIKTQSKKRKFTSASLKIALLLLLAVVEEEEVDDMSKKS
jgi:hypothetical protein